MNATPKMSRTSAVFFLSEMALDAASETQVTALRVACRSLLKRHFDHMGNRVRRRNRKADCQGSAKPEESCQTLANPPAAACQSPAMEEEIRQTLAKAEGGAA